MATKNIRKRRSLVKINFSLPVVLVNRSNKHISAQVLEPVTKKTIYSVNSYSMEGTKTEKSVKVGEVIAKFLKDKNFDKAVFYRNGLIYEGRVSALANSIRENNIQI